MSNGNEGVLCNPQCSIITETSPSNCFESNPGHSLWGGFLPFCREAVDVFDSPSRLGKCCGLTLIFLFIKWFQFFYLVLLILFNIYYLFSSWLVVFYGISALVGYLMANPVMNVLYLLCSIESKNTIKI